MRHAPGSPPAVPKPASPRSPTLFQIILAILAVVLGVPFILFGGLGVVFALASFAQNPGGALTTIAVLLPIILAPLAAGGWLVFMTIRALSRPTRPDRPTDGS